MLSHRLQRGTASVCRTIQVTESEWAFDDTKRKRSRRTVKLQNFVLEALQELLKTREGEREGNCPTMHELILRLLSRKPLVVQKVRLLNNKVRLHSRSDDRIACSARKACQRSSQLFRVCCIRYGCTLMRLAQSMIMRQW